MLRDRVGNIRIGAIDILVFLGTYQCHRNRFSKIEDLIQHLEHGIASSELWGEQAPSSLHLNSRRRHSVKSSAATTDQGFHLYSPS